MTGHLDREEGCIPPLECSAFQAPSASQGVKFLSAEFGSYRQEVIPSMAMKSESNSGFCLMNTSYSVFPVLPVLGGRWALLSLQVFISVLLPWNWSSGQSEQGSLLLDVLLDPAFQIPGGRTCPCGEWLSSLCKEQKNQQVKFLSC